MSKKKYQIRKCIEHAFGMKLIGPCTECLGTAKKNGKWCQACGVTGRRDKQASLSCAQQDKEEQCG